MKLILSYKEYNLTKHLTESELADYLYVIGGLNENVNEGVLDRLKDIAKKGVLTAAVLSTLMGNPTFAKEYKSLPGEEKAKIEQMITSKKDGEKETSNKLLIKVGEYFKSGRYKVDSDGVTRINAKLAEMMKFFKDNEETSFTVKIIASESTLSNKDAETGKPLPQKELARLRATEMEKIYKTFAESQEKFPDVKLVKAPPIVGKETKDFEKDQYVNIEITVNGSGQTLCNNINNESAGQADASTQYVSIGFDKSTKKFKKIDATDMYGSGKVVITPGSVPDRLVLIADGKVIGDTGYFVDRDPNKYREFKYVPSYVAGLTNLRASGAEAGKDSQAKSLIRKTFKTFDDLLEFMLADKYKKTAERHYDWSKENRTEINAKEAVITNPKVSKSPIEQLKDLWEANHNQEFIFYDLTPNHPLEYKLMGQYKTIEYRVYSPLGRTGVGIEAICK
jgi:hypothetical protein